MRGRETLIVTQSTFCTKLRISVNQNLNKSDTTVAGFICCNIQYIMVSIQYMTCSINELIQPNFPTMMDTFPKRNDLV